MNDSTPRDLVVATVRKRATHTELDQVTDTLSNWSTEQIVTDEYHGRFLIELLQNARDALLEADPGTRAGVVRIRLSDEPALVVCNDGDPLRPDVLLHSIGKFGQGTKSHGEAIGHKGIGFKAVLEVSLTPEIYSCRDGVHYGLRARFDPHEARALVRRHSPRWSELVAAAPGSSGPAAVDHVPVLRFPLWVDDTEDRLRGVQLFDGRPFDTVVRLPFDDRFADELHVDRTEFIARARSAMAALSDQMVLLLGAFGTVALEDDTAGPSMTITQNELSAADMPSGGRRRMVSIQRNGGDSTQWILFERRLPGLPGLEGDITVGVRLVTEDGAVRIAGPNVWEGDAGEAFHLFFPTRITTHLPFLLHAYFEVNASRTGFARGEEARNGVLLDGLRVLVRDAIESLVADDAAGELDASGLASLLATGGLPDDALAAEFHDHLLADLDTLKWVPVQPVAAGESYARPVDLLAEPDDRVSDLLLTAFPAGYLHRRLGRRYPDPRVDRPGVRFLADRAQRSRGGSKPGLGGIELRDLLTPGDDSIWEPEPSQMDLGFKALIQVLELLRGSRPDTGAVVEALADDRTATFIPVLDSAPPYRRLRSPTGPSRTSERGTTWILARLGQSSGSLVAPPRALGLDFLADGLLDDHLLSAAQPLGIREYRTETVLDALAGGDRPVEDAVAVTQFAWRLLLRDTASSYAVSKAAEVAGVFEPGRWYWSRPELRSDNERDDLRRARGLARLPIPARDGEWHPADQLAFGDDWAAWAADRAARLSSGADETRAEAYTDLEAVGPDSSVFAASPADLAEALPLAVEDAEALEINTVDTQILRDRHLDLIHAFLLRIGVWEIPPVDSINDLSVRSEEGWDTWVGVAGREAHRRQLARTGAFAAYDHRRVHVGEDYKFRWPMAASIELARGLGRGVDLYRRCVKTYLFCPGCRTHKVRYDNLQEGQRASLLRRQIDHERWVPVSVGTQEVEPVRPLDAWTDADVPDASRMHLSSVRFLPLVPAAFPRELVDFAGISAIETATSQRVNRLLRSLHERQNEYLGSTPRQGTDEGRAYVSLHRRLYERLRNDMEQATAAVDEIGVLVTEGAQLRFAPPAEARHDDGEHTSYKKHFIGRVPFLAVKADQGRIATTLGVPRFELNIERAGSDAGTDVTERVRPFIHDRAIELLAIVCFYSLGGQTLELDSRRFRERAQRLSALQVRQVEDLELDVRVAGLDVSATIGAGQNEDLFVEGPRSVAPVLYHDLRGDHWEDRFRRLLGPHLADILENDAYSTVFRILVEQDTEPEIAGFLLELGIGEDQVKEVADLVESTNRVVRAEEERWWRALLPLLKVDLAVDAADLAWRDHLRDALSVVGLLESPNSLGALLLRRPGTEGARADIEPHGVLARLEAHGIDVELFDRRLRELGDRGLDVRGPQRLLDSWMRAHGTEVVAVLMEAEDAEATRRPASWRLPADLAWAVRTGPVTYLRPVIDDLEAAGLEPIDADTLGAPDASDYLAGLVNLDTEGLLDRWRARSGAEGQGALLREQAAAWRRVLRAILVAGRLDPGAPGYEIRSEADTVDREFAGIDSPGDIADLLDAALPRAAALGQALADYVRSHRSIGVPSADEAATFAAQHVTDPTHLERVRAVLAGAARQVVDRVRRAGAALREIGVTPMPVATSPSPPRRAKDVSQQHVRAVHRGRADTDRIGVAAESWALGAVVQTLLDLPLAERATVVRQMITKLAEHFESAVVDGLIGRAEASLQAVDEDEAIDALIGFLHVSRASDDFGFDLIGHLPGTVGSPPEVLFLEVKSSGGRSFIVSTHEWDVAEREDLRASYAFLVVQRGEGGQPKAMELLRDPATLLADQRITRRENDWRVDYLLREPGSVVP